MPPCPPPLALMAQPGTPRWPRPSYLQGPGACPSTSRSFSRVGACSGQKAGVRLPKGPLAPMPPSSPSEGDSPPPARGRRPEGTWGTQSRAKGSRAPPPGLEIFPGGPRELGSAEGTFKIRPTPKLPRGHRAGSRCKVAWLQRRRSPPGPPSYRHRPECKDGDCGRLLGREGGGDGWGETGQMFLERDTGVTDADWNLKGEHSPRAWGSGWKMDGFSWGGGLPVLPSECERPASSLPGPHTCPMALTPAFPESQALRGPPASGGPSVG